MKPKTEAGVFTAAGSVCGGGFYAVTPDRMILVSTPAGSVPLVDQPVPGESQILAVDANRRSVLLQGGERSVWLGRWVRLPSIFDARAAIRVRALSGTTLQSGDFNIGEERDLPEGEALLLIQKGIAEAVLR